MSRKSPADASPSGLPKGARELREEVLNPGLCTSCGMCLDLCPYLEEMGENVAMISDCRGAEGRCYQVCPRAETELDALREAFFPGWGSSSPDFVLGPHLSIRMARSLNPRAREEGQYGGTVTALTLYGLASGNIDAALLTNWASADEDLYLPIPWLARTEAEVLAAAGSKYSACPTLKILDRAISEGAERLLVVGRPCQALSLRKRMRLPDSAFAADRVALTMSLFCMWSLSYRKFRKLAEPLLRSERIVRMDIPRGRVVARTENGSFELPHDILKEQARKACRYCYDFTGELADLSVGSTEWKEEWNTLIIRNDRARLFVEEAAAHGFIELAPFPEERIRLLREAAFNKKKRVLELLEQEKALENKEPYLKIGQEERDFFLS